MPSVRISMIVLVSTTMAACFAGCSRSEPTMEIFQFELHPPEDGVVLSARDIVISSDGERAATVGGPHDVTVFDTQTRTDVWSRRFDDGRPRFIAFTRDGDSLVAVWRGNRGNSRPEVVRWLDADDGQIVDTFELPLRAQAAGLSPDGRVLVARQNRAVVRYDLESKTVIDTQPGYAYRLAFSSSNDLFAVANRCDDDKTSAAGPMKCESDIVVHETWGDVIAHTRIGLSPHGLTDLDDKAIYTRDAKGNVLAVALDGKTPPRSVTRDALAFTLLPGGGRFAVLHRDGTLAICNIETGERLHACRLPIPTRNRSWELAAGCDGTIAVASHPIHTWPVYESFLGFAKVLPPITK